MTLADRLDERPDWCLSGGADNADLAWGEAAKHAGHGVIHFSFAGHRSAAPSSEIVRLNTQALEAADLRCMRANLTLRRKFPPKSLRVRNLLRRNWYQVETAGSCYAVSTLVDGQVAGGTAWAVAMFLDKHDSAPCAAYVFDQVACRWFRWSGFWEPIYEPPVPAGIWAGIGSRQLTPIGRLAINVALNYWPVRKTMRKDGV